MTHLNPRFVWTFLFFTSADATFFPLTRRGAASFVPPLVRIGWNEVHLKKQVYLGLKIKLTVVGRMALSRGSRNPPRLTMSRF